MHESRRSFLKWTVAFGLIPIVGSRLFAKPAKIKFDSIGCTHMDGEFDPGSWL